MTNRKFRIQSLASERRLIAKYLAKTSSGGGNCLVCRNSYVRFQHAKRHFIRTHTEPYCPVCQIDFTSVKVYMDHRTQVHGAGKMTTASSMGVNSLGDLGDLWPQVDLNFD